MGPCKAEENYGLWIIYVHNDIKDHFNKVRGPSVVMELNAVNLSEMFRVDFFKFIFSTYIDRSMRGTLSDKYLLTPWALFEIDVDFCLKFWLEKYMSQMITKVVDVSDLHLTFD